MAARPRTLSAGVAPVIMGTAMALEAGGFHAPSALLCLLVAISIQIGTNFANDYYDFIKGADTAARLGPTRVTQAGLIAPAVMKRAYIGTMIITVLWGAMLFPRAGWPIAVIAVCSITSGVLYTGGPRPLGYIGLGELFVLIFFGPVALGGTYYVQALEMNLAVLLAGIGPGLWSVAILTVNNLRDVDEDRRAGKRTLAVRYGCTFARWQFAVCVPCACMIPAIIVFLTGKHRLALTACAVVIPALPLMAAVYREQDPRALNPMLGKTARLLLVYCLLFAAGWVVEL